MEGDPKVIILKPGSVTPSRCPPSRAVPIHLESEAEDEINKHLKMGVIEPVTHPMEWTSPAFFTKKPHGGVQLVTDFSKAKPICTKAGASVSEPGGDPSVDPGILQSFCQVRL